MFVAGGTKEVEWARRGKLGQDGIRLSFLWALHFAIEWYFNP